MPRLQVSRRISLLSTNLRTVFLESFNRHVRTDSVKAAPIVHSQTDHNAVSSLNTIARRVQTDMKRVTGRYFPISQVVASIHALKHNTDNIVHCSERKISPPPTPLQIVIIPTSPPAVTNTKATNNSSSMSRRRLACNIPSLQTHLAMPTSTFSPFLSPRSGSPASPLRTLFSMSRRSSYSSGENTLCPVTPIDQIVHTPLSPPKMPRAPPPAPRTWARMNAQMHNDEVSPLPSPTIPSAPLTLTSKRAGRPILNPLRIPTTYPVLLGDAELRDNHLSPSPRSSSPLELVRSPFAEGLSAPTMLVSRPALVRNDSASNLTRTALLRASRPHLARTSSGSDPLMPHTGYKRDLSPISPNGTRAPSSPVTLASPFIIRAEEMDTEYFRF
ncbi:hypothetical protein BD413DRAFT_475781 [Trametes elegans]|nr:hypothetical protein BD413DRAFT_475781 [Trametes elegans]